MTTTLTREEKTYTPDDLLRMSDGDRYELVDGRLVETGMGYLASWIGKELQVRMDQFARANGLGDVLPAETSYRCFPRLPNRVRKPDISFVRRGKVPLDQLPKGFCRVAPDLVVEVVSPNELYAEVLDKVHDYLGADVPLVWIINPDTREVEVRRPSGRNTTLRVGDMLDGEDVLPGFTCPLSAIFPPESAGAE